MTVLPVEGQVYYKRRLPRTDPRYQDYLARYEAVRAAVTAAAEAAPPAEAELPREAPEGPDITLDFYETLPLPLPAPGAASPVLDLTTDTLDQALHLALLAPKNVEPDDARAAIAGKVLSLGVVPALGDDVPPLLPRRRDVARLPAPNTTRPGSAS